MQDAQNNHRLNSWVFMDAGDTFVYGYPTFNLALRDCWRKAGSDLALDRAEEALKAFMKKNPPVNLTDQERFTGFFHDLYRNVLEVLRYPGDVEAGIQWLWSEWLKGERLRLFDDSLSALRRLRDSGFKLGVISNWDRTFDATLERLGVVEFFDFTVASVSVGLSKPDPRLFQYALEQTGAAAERSWYLGDQIEADMVPAKSLGFKTLYVDYYNKGGGDGVADYTVPSMTMAAEVICGEGDERLSKK